MSSSTFSRATLVIAACLVWATAHAQPYPSRPIKIILPFPPGSATDSIARVVSKDMAETLGQPIVVENKPGAGGAIAAEFVAKSPPDGYTVMVASNTQLAANPSLYKQLSYNPVKISRRWRDFPRSRRRCWCARNSRQKRWPNS
jgi:tripartite-type tricarboxylate transporter receptor subunit TctC